MARNGQQRETVGSKKVSAARNGRQHKKVLAARNSWQQEGIDSKKQSVAQEGIGSEKTPAISNRGAGTLAAGDMSCASESNIADKEK